MYPPGSAPQADNWTLNTFLKAAEACHRAGYPFGIGLDAAAGIVSLLAASGRIKSHSKQPAHHSKGAVPWKGI